MQNYHQHNFFTDTCAIYKNVTEKQLKATKKEPDFTSDSGSKYWYTKKGVIRQSDHWGRYIASCHWLHENEVEGMIFGYCEWDAFVDNNILSSEEIEGDTISYRVGKISSHENKKNISSSSIFIENQTIRGVEFGGCDIFVRNCEFSSCKFFKCRMTVVDSTFEYSNFENSEMRAIQNTSIHSREFKNTFVTGKLLDFSTEDIELECIPDSIFSEFVYNKRYFHFVTLKQLQNFKKINKGQVARREFSLNGLDIRKFSTLDSVPEKIEDNETLIRTQRRYRVDRYGMILHLSRNKETKSISLDLHVDLGDYEKLIFKQKNAEKIITAITKGKLTKHLIEYINKFLEGKNLK